MTESKKNLIRGRIIQAGYTMEKFLGLIGMPASTWKSKIDGVTDFKSSEISAIAKALELTPQEIYEYFFA